MKLKLLPGVLLVFLFAWPLVSLANNAVTDRWIKAINNNSVDKLSEMISITSDHVLATTRAANGKTALMIACKLGDMPLINRLLSLGADADARTETGGTPLMFASLGGHIDIARLLVSLDVDLNAQGSNGWTAVTIAAAKGYDQLLTYLLSLDTDVNVSDIYRWTPLMRAVDNLHFDAVSVLLAQPKVALDNQDEAGNTALHHAVARNAPAFLKALLERGADRSIRNDAGFTPLELVAATSGSERLLELFQQH